MLDLTKSVAYLRSSLKLQSPSIETDEAYKYTDIELQDIIKMMIPMHKSEYTVDNFPPEEENFVILLAKKEIYYRLATATAPLYPLTAEGAELRKDVRFDHYMSLIRRVEAEYAQTYERFQSNTEIKVGDVFLAGKHLSLRNYEHAVVPTVTLKAITIRSDSVDVSWDKFEVERGQFLDYVLYVSTSPIYDEFIEKISEQATKVDTIRDIHKIKYRITGLTPATVYYLAVVSEDINTLKGISEISITTLA